MLTTSTLENDWLDDFIHLLGLLLHFQTFPCFWVKVWLQQFPPLSVTVYYWRMSWKIPRTMWSNLWTRKVWWQRNQRLSTIFSVNVNIRKFDLWRALIRFYHWMTIVLLKQTSLDAKSMCIVLITNYKQSCKFMFPLRFC